MKKILLTTLLLVNFTALAETPFHLSIVPVESNKEELTAEIVSNLESVLPSNTWHNCKSVEIRSNNLKSYKKGLFGSTNQVLGSISGVIYNCDNNYSDEIDILTGVYDRDAEDNGRYYNISLDVMVNGENKNTLNFNFVDDSVNSDH